MSDYDIEPDAENDLKDAGARGPSKGNLLSRLRALGLASILALCLHPIGAAWAYVTTHASGLGLAVGLLSLGVATFGVTLQIKEAIEGKPIAYAPSPRAVVQPLIPWPPQPSPYESLLNNAEPFRRELRDLENSAPTRRTGRF